MEYLMWIDTINFTLSINPIDKTLIPQLIQSIYTRYIYFLGKIRLRFYIIYVVSIFYLCGYFYTTHWIVFSIRVSHNSNPSVRRKCVYTLLVPTFPTLFNNAEFSEFRYKIRRMWSGISLSISISLCTQ